VHTLRGIRCRGALSLSGMTLASIPITMRSKPVGTLVFILLLCACGDRSRSERTVEPIVESSADEYPQPGGAWSLERSDVESLLRRGEDDGLTTRSVGERMTGFGAFFLGLPYVAHTLELPGEEQLVVNLKELDCVTLVENALALSHASVAGSTVEAFLSTLQQARYRDGRLDGYPSRLHYFSDWLSDAERKGLVRNVTRDLGGVPYERPIHFMTSNREAYRQLAADEAEVERMREVERRLNAESLFWIPGAEIARIEDGILEGDIIGITTAVDGLDISHTGLATWRGGRVHILHAPDVGQPVEVSRRPLAERVAANRMQTGIMVARPLEP